ncbi:hypothetical protein F4677DRAFT_441978 [Hypoxylon crocopeplum]|nr:hypothetical protein F4677DRAFT_441978 [Hypoxylon crocopeplum]
MSCHMPECHYVRPNGSRTKLNHDKNTIRGTAFYYCSMHSVYHCIVGKAHRRLPQLFCGECAWLFFKFPVEANKYPQSDILATGGPNDGIMVATPSPWFMNTNGYELGQWGGATTDALFGSSALDRNKRPLPTIEETLDNLNERLQRTDSQKHTCRRRSNAISHQDLVPDSCE